MDEEKKTAAPEAKDAAPEKKDAMPQAKDAAPEAKDAAPEKKDAKSEKKDAKPKKRKKWLVRIAVGLVVFLVALVMFLWLLLDLTVAAAVRNVTPRFTGTEVELKSVSIGIISGRVELNGFKVANPKGFAHKYAFELDKFICRVDLSTVLSDKIIVEEVTIDGMLTDYEMSLNGSNLAQIQKNVESALGVSESRSADADAKPADDGKTPKKAKKDPKVVIRKLSVSGIRLASGVVKLPLPPIALNDLGEDCGLGEVINKFYFALMKSISSVASSQAVQGIGNAAKGIGNAASDAGKSVSDGIKKLFK